MVVYGERMKGRELKGCKFYLCWKKLIKVYLL